MDFRTANLLDECVAEVRASRKTVAQCLAEHPEVREELESLLPIALAIAPPVASLEPQRKLRARAEFIEALHRKRPAGRWWSWSFDGLKGPYRQLRFGVAALIGAVVLTLTATASAGLAAKESLPGDLLYGLKTAVEQVQITLAVSPEAKAQVRLQIAGERLGEVERALASGKGSAAEVAATAYASAMAHAAEDIESAPEKGAFAERLRDLLAENLRRQETLIDRASAAGTVATQEALRRAREPGRRAGEHLPSVGGPPFAGAATATPRLTPTPPGARRSAVDNGPRLLPGSDLARPAGATATPRATVPPEATSGAPGGRDGDGARLSVPPTRTLAASPDEGRGRAPEPSPTRARRPTEEPTVSPGLLPTRTAEPTRNGRGRPDGGEDDEDRRGARPTPDTPSRTPSPSPVATAGVIAEPTRTPRAEPDRGRRPGERDGGDGDRDEDGRRGALPSTPTPASAPTPPTATSRPLATAGVVPEPTPRPTPEGQRRGRPDDQPPLPPVAGTARPTGAGAPERTPSRPTVSPLERKDGRGLEGDRGNRGPGPR